MPTYSYKCKNNHVWELNRTINKRDNPCKCPKCKKTGKRQYIVPANIQFIGGGFYSTDNKKKVP